MQALIDKSSSELSLVLQGDVAGQIKLLTLEDGFLERGPKRVSLRDPRKDP